MIDLNKKNNEVKDTKLDVHDNFLIHFDFTYLFMLIGVLSCFVAVCVCGYVAITTVKYTKSNSDITPVVTTTTICTSVTTTTETSSVTTDNTTNINNLFDIIYDSIYIFKTYFYIIIPVIFIYSFFTFIRHIIK